MRKTLTHIENNEVTVVDITPDRWSNSACKGYVITVCQRLGYTRKQIQDILATLSNEFDCTSVDDAKRIYIEF